MKELCCNTLKFPGCCLAIILYSFSRISRDHDISTKENLDNVLKLYGVNVAYATDIQDSKVIDKLLELGFNIIDTNFNNNSGNVVYLLKYVKEK